MELSVSVTCVLNTLTVPACAPPLSRSVRVRVRVVPSVSVRFVSGFVSGVVSFL